MANIEEVLQRGEALSGTGNGQCLAHSSVSPQSAGWAERPGGKGLTLLRKAVNTVGVSVRSVVF